MRFCYDIGMFTIDRSRNSCVWKTSFCSKNCYNSKLYKVYHHTMIPRDIINDIEWNELNGIKLKNILKKKKKPYNRIRLMSRGEAFSNHNDILKVDDILNENENIIFWIPTRAWRGCLYKELVELKIKYKNARILASIDPSTNDNDIKNLKDDGWSTMFFGDNDKTYGMYKCPKTWQHEKGYCYICEDGCFNNKRVDVHLRKH